MGKYFFREGPMDIKGVSGIESTQKSSMDISREYAKSTNEANDKRSEVQKTIDEYKGFNIDTVA